MIGKSPHHLATLIVLLVLTAVTAALSLGHATWLAGAILSIALLKMILVTFRFMDLRHAHLFWKSAILLLTGSLIVSLFVLSIM